ncbi:MAG TPA: response regulator [Clostridiaceae bacterium]|nr:response regulator [Clostridiaceae bacterium]
MDTSEFRDSQGTTAEGQNLIRIAVADDEPQIREGIKYVLSDLVDEMYLAADGEKAYETVIEYDIDILITDIRMPGIDGLEMVRALREGGSDCKVIVISGYKNFDYAQEAVRLGASGYILKPIDESLLLEAVKKCIRKIRRERESILEKTEMKQEARKLSIDYIRLVMLSFLNNDVTPDIDGDQVEKYTFLKKVMSYDYYRVALIKCEGLNNCVHCLDEARRIFADVKENARVKVRDKHSKLMVLPDKDEMIFVFMWNGEKETKMGLTWIMRLRTLAARWKHEFDAYAYVGISDTVSQFKQISEAYCEAAAVLFFSEHTHICQQKIGDVLCECNAKRPEKALQEGLSMAVLQGDICTAKALIIEWIKLLVCVDGAKNLAAAKAMFADAAQATAERFGNRSPETEAMRMEWLMSIQSANHLDKLFHTMVDGIIFFHEIWKNADTGKRKIVEEIKEYISANLQTELTLKRVAEEFYFSPNYLSRLFSESEGESFKQYLTRERVKKAKQLLKDPKIKIYEIANMLGYREARNFMKVFKSVTGRTMTEYREQS